MGRTQKDVFRRQRAPVQCSPERVIYVRFQAFVDGVRAPLPRWVIVLRNRQGFGEALEGAPVREGLPLHAFPASGGGALLLACGNAFYCFAGGSRLQKTVSETKASSDLRAAMPGLSDAASTGFRVKNESAFGPAFAARACRGRGPSTGATVPRCQRQQHLFEAGSESSSVCLAERFPAERVKCAIKPSFLPVILDTTSE